MSLQFTWETIQRNYKKFPWDSDFSVQFLNVCCFIMAEHLILFVIGSLLCLDECSKFKSRALTHNILEICCFYTCQRSLSTYSPVSVLSPLLLSVFLLLSLPSPSSFSFPLSSYLSFALLALRQKSESLQCIEQFLWP